MENNSLSAAIQRLTGHIQSVPEKFNELPADMQVHKPAPGKWSRQEIIGHLTDSAINNLKRFTDCQYMPPPYTVVRYNQDELVAINRYQQLPLEHILLTWKLLNQQILYVISNIPAEKLRYTVITPSGESKTLEWLIIDYVDHLEHHLQQVFG